MNIRLEFEEYFYRKAHIVNHINTPSECVCVEGKLHYISSRVTKEEM